MKMITRQSVLRQINHSLCFASNNAYSNEGVRYLSGCFNNEFIESWWNIAWSSSCFSMLIWSSSCFSILM